jgi:hypothetical protein
MIGAEFDLACAGGRAGLRLGRVVPSIPEPPEHELPDHVLNRQMFRGAEGERSFAHPHLFAGLLDDQPGVIIDEAGGIHHIAALDIRKGSVLWVRVLPCRGHYGLKIEPENKINPNLNKILGTDPFSEREEMSGLTSAATR